MSIIAIAHPRRLILVFLSLAGSLSLLDQTRWQPWFFLYFFMLAVVGFSEWDKTKDRGRAALYALKLIIAFTYFWSGIQKFNVNFVRETWPDVASSALRLLPQSVRHLPPFLILMVPGVEILIGVGLLTLRFRQIAAALAVITHLVILILLVMSGENTVVWPWNIAMVLFVAVLFLGDKDATGIRVLTPKTVLHVFVLLLFGFLPALNFVGLWDSYFSSALYSGNTHQAAIIITPEVIDRLPDKIHEYIWQKNKPFFLDINRWAFGELNVPAYPEPRIYRVVTEQICKYADDSPDIRLMIKSKPDLFTARRTSEYYDCEHLE